MKQFNTVTSTALPIRTENIDTDQIIPARYLKTTKRDGLGQYLFSNLRIDDEGHKLKDSIFDNEKYKAAKILIAGNNFGCGSSREHAPWALLDYGFEVILSSSFGDIFYNNSMKNGLLPVVINHHQLDELLDIVEKNPETEITIDLEKQSVSILKKNISYHFSIDPFRKICLLQGVDELGFILSHEKEIKEFESRHTIFISK